MVIDEIRRGYIPVVAILEKMPAGTANEIITAVRNSSGLDDLDIIPSEAFDEIGAVVLLARPI